jgi:hypothetical protein
MCHEHILYKRGDTSFGPRWHEEVVKQIFMLSFHFEIICLSPLISLKIRIMFKFISKLSYIVIGYTNPVIRIDLTL